MYRHHPPQAPDRWIDLRGKLGTGADLCVLPEHAVAALQLAPARTIQARGYDGMRMSRVTYLVHLQVAGFHFEGVEAVSSMREDILVGRNVLNHFVITLNSKELTFDLEDP